MSPPIFARKASGPYEGSLLHPHLYSDGTYVATTSRYKADYVKVATLDELVALVRAGYGARMSNPETGQGASYIAHASIGFTVREEPLGPIKRMLSSYAANDQLDGKTLANYRKEQAFLRAYLLKGQPNGKCVLCGRMLPAEVLIAAHIKPRSECTSEEKRDFDNVAVLMCDLGCDGLFENGFVYVIDGQIRKNPRRRDTAPLAKEVKELEGRTVPNWSSSSAYYRWHAIAFGYKK